MDKIEHLFDNKKTALQYEYCNIKNPNNFLVFLQKEARPLLLNHFKRHLNRSCWKYSIEIQVTFHKLEPSNDRSLQITELQPWFRCQNKVCLQNQDNLGGSLNDCFEEIQNAFDKWIHLGSGYTFVEVVCLRLSVAKFIPFSGGCSEYDKNHLPIYIQRKQCLVTIVNRNNTDHCFLDSVRVACTLDRTGAQVFPAVFDLSARYTVPEETFDERNLSFPTHLNQIKLFEDRNNFLSINVYAVNRNYKTLVDLKLKKKVKSPICVLHHSQSSELGKVIVDLLYHDDHYYLIRNMSRLIGRNRKSFICRSCLTLYSSDSALSNHKRSCSNDGILYDLPDDKDKTVKFKNLESQMMKDWIIYYDFETSVKPVLEERKSKRRFVHRHVPLAAGGILICTSNKKWNSDVFISFGENCANDLLDWMEKMIFDIHIIYENHSMAMVMTDDDWNSFLSQDNCECCGVQFNETIGKFRDHCKLSSNYRKALCNNCNLHIFKQVVKNIPCYAHNASRYDLSLLIRAMANRRRINGGRFRVIQKTSEQNFVVFYRDLMFVDSLNWLNASLSKLIDLRKLEETETTDKVFPMLYDFVGRNDEKYKLLTRKQILPYTYLTGISVLSQTSLPDKDAFYDILREQSISDDDFQHANTVYNVFRCKNIGMYVKIYLSTDVLLLCEIFEYYRKMEFREFKIDVSHFWSLAHFSFNAMLKYTNVQYDLITDVDQYNWIRSSIRGGVTFIGQRHARANWPDLPHFNPDEELKEITYWDIRSLYSSCLRKPLPRGDYKWLSDEQIDIFDISKAMNDENTGFILEVDLEIDETLHDFLCEYPPCADHVQPDASQWSDYQKNLAQLHGVKKNRKVRKLIAHLGPRKNYVIHVSHLVVCLRLGIRITKIHRILTFEQSCWARDYIDCIAEKRKNAKTTFESNMLKVQSNSIYGNLNRDTSKYRNVKMVTSSDEFLRHSRKSNFTGWTAYGKHLAGVQLRPITVSLRSPVAAAFTVLERSKEKMLRVWYGLLKSVYENNIHILLSDTDSFITLTRGGFSVMEMMERYPEHFDRSELPEPYFNDDNSMVPGKLKDELAGRDRIVEYVGLRSKVYCLKLLKRDDEKRVKGLAKHVVKSITFEDYLNTLFNPSAPKRYNYFCIRSLKLEMFTMNERKVGLASFDDSRVISQDGIHTKPYFYVGKKS